MDLDYTTKGEVKIDTQKYVKNMIDNFPINIKKSQAVASPATKYIFKVDGSNPLKIINRNCFIQQWLEVFSYAKYPDRTFSPQLCFYALE